MKYIMLLFALLILSGCASYGKEIRQSSVNGIQRGITTKQEVIKTFGEPDGTYFNSNSELILHYYAGKIKQSGWNFVPVVSLFHSEMKIQNQMLVIVFDNSNVVKEYSFTNPDKKITSGIIP